MGDLIGQLAKQQEQLKSDLAAALSQNERLKAELRIKVRRSLEGVFQRLTILRIWKSLE